MRRTRTAAVKVAAGMAACLALAACSTDAGVVAIRSERLATESTESAGETPPSTTDDTGSPSSTSPSSTTEAPTPDTSEPPRPDLPTELVPVGDGAGDGLFPDLGNPGIDVVDYAVEITYDPLSDTVSGSVTLVIDVTDDRTEFTLDSAGPDIERVQVDGQDATFEEDRVELRITPAAAVDAGSRIEVTVEYSVATESVQSDIGLPNGWFNTTNGSYVLNEPDGARTWLPSNDHPSDKASWTFAITVPSGVTAVANGSLVSSQDSAAGTTWTWRQDEPMATYLVMLITGDYELVEGVGPAGLPLVSAVLRDDLEQMQPYLDTIDDQIAFFEEWFGPFPLAGYGIAITDSFGGLAMETQGRSLFSRDDFSGQMGFLEELLLSHELSHQWFGDAVSPAQWSDIWLNESFASYAQWMWLEHVGLSELDQDAERALAGRQDGMGSPTISPSVDEMFGFNSYEGGAVVLHALRRTVGDDAFFELLRRWAADNYGQSRFTADFLALAEEVSGDDLAAFFDDWLFADRLPSTFP
ncbi:MAG: M1 family metallopeptidase [Actinomycetota bacterium]